ncbi:hypothetical protein HAX54_027384, partial [Datura stramonium]|nr:hypothetical protein [Datura stramonium]
FSTRPRTPPYTHTRLADLRRQSSSSIRRLTAHRADAKASGIRLHRARCLPNFPSSPAPRLSVRSGDPQPDWPTSRRRLLAYVMMKVTVSDVGSTDNSLRYSNSGIQRKGKKCNQDLGVWAHFDKVVENGIGRAKCKYQNNTYAAPYK